MQVTWKASSPSSASLASRPWGLWGTEPLRAARLRLAQLSHVLRRLFRERGAQDLAEYGIALAVIGAGAATAALVIRGNVVEMWVEHARVLHKIASLSGS